jgi:hypothetical protein
VTDNPTARNPFALLAAYVGAVLRPERPARTPRPERAAGRRRAGGRRRPFATPRPIIRPEQRPELLAAPATPPPGDVDTREE